MKRKGGPEARAAERGGGGGGGDGGDDREGGGGGDGGVETGGLWLDATPAFVVSGRRCKQNCLSMLRRAQSLGVHLRPHVKTHKTIELGLWQLGYDLGKEHDDQKYTQLCSGIVASTVAEVRFFARGDRRFSDILYGVPLCLSRVAALLELQNTCAAKLHVLIDHPTPLAALLHAVKTRKEREGASFSPAHPLGVFIKIDCGYHRAGLDPTFQVGEIEGLIATVLGQGKSWLSFSGIYSHSGHSYAIGGDRESISAIGLEEAAKMAALFRHLERKGYPPPIVSIGATPSCSVLPQTVMTDVNEEVGENCRSLLRLLLQKDVPWELHPGNYSLYDVMQLRIGACTINDIAGRVVTRVLSVYPSRKQFIIDAGGAALSKDSIAEDGNGGISARWGYIIPKVGHARMSIKSVSQECSVVDFLEEDLSRMPKVGELVKVLPVHSCMAAMCHPHYYLHRVGDGQKRNLLININNPDPSKITPCKYWS